MSKSASFRLSGQPPKLGRCDTTIGSLTTSAVIIALALPIGAVPAFAQQATPVPLEKAPRRPAAIELPSPLSLPQAIDLALALQPSLVSSDAEKDRAKQQERGVTASYYPTVTPSYTYVYQYTFGSSYQLAGNNVFIPVQSGQSYTTKQFQVALSYNIWDSGVRDLNARSARQNVRLQDYNEKNTRQTVIVNVATAYFSVLRNDALIKVAQSQVERAKNTLDVVKAQVEAGVAARKDIYQAEADFLTAQVTALNARTTGANAQATLKSALGLIGGEPLNLGVVTLPTAATHVATEVTGIDQDAFTLSDKFDVATTVNALTQAAFKARADVAQSETSLDISKTAVKQSQVAAGVTVNAAVSAAQQFDPNTFDRDTSQTRQANVTIAYPLFDGGLVRSQVRASQAGVRDSDAQLATLKLQVAVDVEQAYRNLIQSRAAIPATESAQHAAQINYDAAIESRKEGVGSLVDVITAQTTLVQAQTNYIQSVYDFYTADANLAHAVGQADRIRQIGNEEGAKPTPVK